MLEKLSGDAVEPDQLAQLHDLGLSQPLRPAQIPGGAEVEWWKLGSMVLGRACININFVLKVQSFYLPEGMRTRFTMQPIFVPHVKNPEFV